MFSGSVCVWDKAVPNPAAAPVAWDISPRTDPWNDVAVTTPLNLAPPSSYIVDPEPIGVSPPRTFIPAASIPILWTFVDPVLKLENVATPTEKRFLTS